MANIKIAIKDFINMTLSPDLVALKEW